MFDQVFDNVRKATEAGVKHYLAGLLHGLVCEHDIAIDRIGGGCHARTVAPDEFLFFFGGAVGLHLIETFFDAETTIGVVDGLLVFLEALGNVGTPVVFFDPRINRGHIKGHDLAKPRNFLA